MLTILGWGLNNCQFTTDNKLPMILLVSASLNPGNESASRRLGEYASEQLQQRLPSQHMTRRDLSQQLPPLMTSENMAAIVSNDSSTPATAAHLQLSDEIADEVAAADRIVIAMPIYNLFMPAGLKAYIDLLIRRGKNFKDSPTGPQGLLTDRPLLVIVTSGGPLQAIDKNFLHNYFKRTFGFIGIHNVELITAENLNTTKSLAETSLLAAQRAIATYAQAQCE